MPSLRSTGKIVASPTSVAQLAQGRHLPFPFSLRALIEALGVRGDIAIPFIYGTHNLSFKNFTDGVPDLGTFRETFGTAEILDEWFDPIFGHPFLTTAFYAFYHHYLKGKANGGLATGFCTSLASLVADNFWTGRTDTNTISKDSVHKFLTAVHGKLLSRQSLTHFYSQGREGIARVERSCREIEAMFLRGCDRKRAPLLFFVPSGDFWASGYNDALNNSHCVMPYRFKYPLGHRGPQLSSDGKTTISELGGVELYVWDCNHPNDPDCKLTFKNNGGSIDFDYPKNPDLSSQKGITLGMMTNGDYLLADHDLPFDLSLTKFIIKYAIDFLLSPADLQITDANGRRTGNFGGQIRAEIPGSLPCYLVPGAYMLPDNIPLTRRITGTGTGQYTYNSISPSAGSVVLQSVATALGQTDLFSANADLTQLRFTPAAEKTFNLIVSRQIGSQVRGLVVSGAGGGPAANVDIAASANLSQLTVSNQGAARKLEVSAMLIDPSNSIKLNKPITTINLTSQSDLKIDLQDWSTLRADVQTLHRTK